MPVNRRRVRIAQLCQPPLDLGKAQYGVVRVEGEYPDQKGLAVERVLPEDVNPSGIERPGARDPRDGTGGIEIAGRKRVSRGKAVFARALQKNIAVEPVDDLERGAEDSPLKAELHQHQQHRETDAAAGTEEARLVRDQIAPGERHKSGRRPKVPEKGRVGKQRQHARRSEQLDGIGTPQATQRKQCGDRRHDESGDKYGGEARPRHRYREQRLFSDHRIQSQRRCERWNKRDDHNQHRYRDDRPIEGTIPVADRL